MSAKELNIDVQNRIIQLRQQMEKGEIKIPDYHEALRALGLNPAEPRPCDPDVKTGDMIGRFMLFLRKIKHTLTNDPHYYLMLTWPEIQALINLTDSSKQYEELDVTFSKLCSKMSEQLKWQAEGPR